MIAIKDSLGEQLSFATNNVSPVKKEGQIIKRRLLDGSYHVQTIGKSSTSKSMTIYAELGQVNKINEMQANGAHFIITDEESTQEAFLSKELTWKLTLRGRVPIYVASATFLYV